MGAAEAWTVAEAKSKFSEVVERARTVGPQIITKRGHLAAVVVSAEEWERRIKRVGSLAEFFAASPLRDSNIDIERYNDQPPKIDL